MGRKNTKSPVWIFQEVGIQTVYLPTNHFLYLILISLYYFNIIG
jgi:hypothetical protein